MDLLVSYGWTRSGEAKREILGIPERFGDEHAQVEHTSVQGIALVHTALDPRAVVRRCRELFHEQFICNRPRAARRSEKSVAAESREDLSRLGPGGFLAPGRQHSLHRRDALIDPGRGLALDLIPQPRKLIRQRTHVHLLLPGIHAGYLD